MRQPLPIRPATSETDLRPQNFCRVADAANDAKTTGIGDSSSKLRSSSDVHSCCSSRRTKTLRQHLRTARRCWRRTCEKDGVLNAKEFGEWCRDGGHVERRIWDGGESRQREMRRFLLLPLSSDSWPRQPGNPNAGGTAAVRLFLCRYIQRERVPCPVSRASCLVFRVPCSVFHFPCSLSVPRDHLKRNSSHVFPAGSFIIPKWKGVPLLSWLLLG